MHINSHINSHDILDELSQKLKQVYLNIINDSTFDYLEEIKIIMNEFDL
jgi:NADPH-dependent 7-cyano-7-deazaguanine reductase QueF-like protein